MCALLPEKLAMGIGEKEDRKQSGHSYLRGPKKAPKKNKNIISRLMFCTHHLFSVRWMKNVQTREWIFAMWVKHFHLQRGI
jgi:hypothetical protein